MLDEDQIDYFRETFGDGVADQGDGKAPEIKAVPPPATQIPPKPQPSGA